MGQPITEASISISTSIVPVVPSSRMFRSAMICRCLERQQRDRQGLRVGRQCGLWQACRLQAALRCRHRPPAFHLQECRTAPHALACHLPVSDRRQECLLRDRCRPLVQGWDLLLVDTVLEAFQWTRTVRFCAMARATTEI